MFRLNIILYISVALILLSCSSSSQNDAEQSSTAIIPKEKMIVVLADIQITEAYIDELRKDGIQTRDTSLIYFEKVFKKHDITPVEFENSMLFYKKDLINMDEMYTEVITRLNELKAKSEEIVIQMKEDSIKQDSLQRILELTDSVNMRNDTIFVNDSLIRSDSNNISQ